MGDAALPEVFPSMPPTERNIRDVKLGTAFVYIMQDGEHGPIKIGWAVNPFARLKQLQVGNPTPLRLIYYEDTYDRQDAQRLEGEIHREFRGHRVRGEWFRLTGSVYRFVLHCHYGASIQAILGLGGHRSAPSDPDEEDDTDNECEQEYQ